MGLLYVMWGMDCICIKIIESGECRKLDRYFWFIRNRNGILATPHRCLALGVGDGEQIWSLGELEGYPQARIIPLAEYLASLGQEDPDSELTPDEALNIILGGNV